MIFHLHKNYLLKTRTRNKTRKIVLRTDIRHTFNVGITFDLILLHVFIHSECIGIVTKL